VPFRARSATAQNDALIASARVGSRTVGRHSQTLAHATALDACLPTVVLGAVPISESLEEVVCVTNELG
jgi:hypothetical protein